MKKTFLKTLMLPMACTVPLLASSAAEIPPEKIPFIIVRVYGTGEANQEFLEAAFKACRKHPGLIEEFWFAGIDSRGTQKQLEKAVAETLSFREKCKKHKIAFSYQQGVTLGHGKNGISRPMIPEDAWAVDGTGVRCNGVYCPTSPFAREANFHTAEYTLRVLQPESYWPDDDLRVSVKPKYICCCDRCLALFNRRFKHRFTRDKLIGALEKDAKIREEWTLSNAQNLGEFAKVFREAVDRAAPDCKLGLQTVWSSCTYDGPDFYPILKAFSGPKNKKVGIRPGAGFYTDRALRGMLEKAIDVQRESARCARYGFVDQVSYEAENWPHIGIEKNPYTQMTECALMLASGCNSLALYWGTDLNAESPELTGFYFETLAKYKPYLLAVRKAFANTNGSGMALYHGKNYYSTPGWMEKRYLTDIRLMENALPVTVMEGEPELFVLNDRCIQELAEEDLQPCFSRTVLMDASSFKMLSKRFPHLKFIRKITMADSKSDPLKPEDPRAEVFENGKRALNFWMAYRPNGPEVKTFSSVSNCPGACGTCVIPTEFGGHVVLVQSLDYEYLWTGYRRKAALDAMDSVKPLSVRLLTGGFSVSVTGRRTKEGKTAGAFLLNISGGLTLPLKIALRDPAHPKYMLIRPGQKDVELVPAKKNKSEVVFDLPPLPAWQSMTIAGKQGFEK